jgi:hypothetical protein
VVLEYDGVAWRKILRPLGHRPLPHPGRPGEDLGWARLGDFGYLEPDAHGTLQYQSLLEKVPPEQRNFNDVWQTLITPQGNFFRAYERLFRWDGRRLHAWATQTRFQALAEVRGRIYTSQTGVGLEEIVGDELRPLPGGEAYKNSRKLFLHPYDDAAHGGLSLGRNAHPL